MPRPPRLTIFAAVLLSVAGGAAWFWWPDRTDRPSLPYTIGSPWSGIWPALGTDLPEAAMVYQANDYGGLAVVGAHDDTVRRVVQDCFCDAGVQALLSPDGRHLALSGHIVDLGTGRETPLRAAAVPVASAPDQPAPAADDLPPPDAVPQAWSPDGRLLAVASYRSGVLDESEDVPPDLAYVGDGRAVITLYDTVTATSRRLATVSAAIPDGWRVAFAPDGSRVAVQDADAIRVYRVDGALERTLHAGGRLAGRGAWTPDGTGLLVMAGDFAEGGVGWDGTVGVVDAVSGESTPRFWSVEATTIRAIGWRPSGDPVVVVYRDESTTGTDWLLRPTRLTSGDGRARVVALTSDGRPRTLFDGGSGVWTVDVAESVLAGGVLRRGPRHLPGRTGQTVLFVLMCGLWFRRRRTRAARHGGEASYSVGATSG